MSTEPKKQVSSVTKHDESSSRDTYDLTAADISFAKAFVKVTRLLCQYKIPRENNSGEEIDLSSRLFQLVLSLADTHPKHKTPSKRGAKRKWDEFAKAALVIEVNQLRNEGKKSGEKFILGATCKKIAERKHWKTFLRGVENPAETLRQNYLKWANEESLKNFIFFYEGKSEEQRQHYVRVFLKNKTEVALNPNLKKNIDQMMHRKLY